MLAIRSICVFCGASAGADPAYAAVATAVGRRLASSGIELVYGGGRLGLMGVVADAALAAGGRVVGVIPRGLVDRELAHPRVTELRIVDTLHERKAEMARLADGFIALPGGLGTLEELTEVLSWAQLDLHAKPIGLLDVAGYYASFEAFLDHAVRQGFIAERHRRLLLRDEDLDRLLERFAAWEPPPSRFALPPATGRARINGADDRSPEPGAKAPRST
ncbi:MAG TPA: TIGR00730 family Rossman fold protein [Candidatus Limnocylindrales bacterium]|nr:TIGR00730 family Rossman fold protein [Candidatus Limnocylindrales bacterium]